MAGRSKAVFSGVCSGWNYMLSTLYTKPIGQKHIQLVPSGYVKRKKKMMHICKPMNIFI